MGDYMVRATAADAQIRAFAVTSRELTEAARAAHNTSPVVTAALGRLMAGALMMGGMLKDEKDILTLQIRGAGSVHGITATADAAGHVKGYADNPQAMMPPNSVGKLDVGGVIGAGVLHVMKDMGLKEPYVSTITLQTGEIADDLTYYFVIYVFLRMCFLGRILLRHSCCGTSSAPRSAIKLIATHLFSFILFFNNFCYYQCTPLLFSAFAKFR